MAWFKTFAESERPAKFDLILQSWDTANKPTELSDFSVCLTCGIIGKHIYFLNVFRERLGYPELKCAVHEQAEAFGPHVILIEDKASGTALIQDLSSEEMHGIQSYETSINEEMRMYSVTGMMENSFVHLPDKAPWLPDYLHELMSFPGGKFDDQADATSQALAWFKARCMNPREPFCEAMLIGPDDFVVYNRRSALSH